MDDNLTRPPQMMRRPDRSKAAVAASRQKSCNACVRGKRRCDKTMPRCTRCAAKGLDCVYQKMPSQAAATTSSSTASSTSPASSTITSNPPPVSMSHGRTHDACADFSMSDFDLDACMDNNPGSRNSDGGPSTAVTSPEPLQLDPDLDFSITDLLGGTGPNPWSLPALQSPKPDFPISLMPNPIRDLAPLRDPLSNDCMSPMDPLLVHDPRSRVGFIVNYATNLPMQFARSREVSFIHPRLYTSSVPRPIMSAFCAAMAYANRTPETKAWVIHLISEAVREVIKESSGSNLTIVEKLARVQAMIILDAIRMFDGDVMLRSASEKDGALFNDWVNELSEIRDELERTGPSPDGVVMKDHPPKTWDQWILLESVRRTVVMAAPVRCIVRILQGDRPDMSFFIHNYWTASRSLWEASTSASFFRAWRESPQWRIHDWNFDDFWMYGRAEDADEFTRIMLTTRVGPEAMDHYMQGDVGIPVS